MTRPKIRSTIPGARDRSRPALKVAACIVAALIVAPAPAVPREPAGGASPHPIDTPHEIQPTVAGHDSATIRHRFEDAEHWARVFEDPARDEWQKPDHVLEFIGLDSTDFVADIGSATGYFDVRFARAVPAGKVYAVDIEPSLVDFLNRRAREEKLGNLRSLLGEPQDPHIPEPVNLIFVCDTYHHLDARVEYFHRLKSSLLTDGRIVIVDFKPGDLPVGPGPDHKIETARIVAEMFAAGYELRRSDDTLPYQFILEFTARPAMDLKAPEGPQTESGP